VVGYAPIFRKIRWDVPDPTQAAQLDAWMGQMAIPEELIMTEVKKIMFLLSVRDWVLGNAA
jgi:hypothetical protein